MRTTFLRRVALVCALHGCGDAHVDAPPEPAPTPPWQNPPGPPSCSGGDTLCGYSCVDTRTYVDHCGACGRRCGGGMVCSDGVCGCRPGRTACDEVCVDTRTDRRNCGRCGARCREGERCASGMCQCDGGEVRCGGACVDASSDPANCGACGRACGEGESCVWGHCEVSCAWGTARCGGDAACGTSLAQSAQHCGRCDHPCPSGTACRDGWCAGEAPAPGGAASYTFSPPISCDPRLPPWTCPAVPNARSSCSMDGVCRFSCAGSEPAGDCDHSHANGCETALSSAAHCGACGRACRAGQHCADGDCRCPQGQTSCGDRCADLQDDRAHCGRCGAACNALEDCAAGRCAPRAAVRLLAPPSGAVLGTRRPTFRWLRTRDESGATVEVCRDRACAQVLATLEGRSGEAAASGDLPEGVSFWRVRWRRATGPGGESPTWALRVAAGARPTGGLVGHFLDVNGDGLADLLPRQLVDGRACVHLGARGGLSEAVCAEPAAGDAWQVPLEGPLAGGDFDGDGFGDVAAFPNGAPRRAFIFRGGAAGLSPGGWFDHDAPVEVEWSSFALYGVGDVDGDGYADLAVGYEPRPQNRVLTLRGGGPAGAPWAVRQEFRSQHSATPTFGATATNVGDVDGDGAGDLVVTSPGTLGWGVAYVHPGGPTRLPSVPAAMLTTPSGFTPPFGYLALSGDVTGDGFADVVLAGGNGLALYAGGPRPLTPAPSGTVRPAPLGFAPAATFGGSGDIHGDGFADVVTGPVSGVAEVALQVYAGGRDGLAATSAQVVDAASSPSGQTVLHRPGDLNGDGRDDVAVEGDTELVVYLGAPSSPGLTLTQRIPLGATSR